MSFVVMVMTHGPDDADCGWQRELEKELEKDLEKELEPLREIWRGLELIVLKHY